MQKHIFVTRTSETPGDPQKRESLYLPLRYLVHEDVMKKEF
jgi:hypothetical protein